MTYLENHRGKGRRKLIATIIVIVFIIIGALQFFIPHFLPAIFTTIAAPFWRAEFAVSEGSLMSREALLRENVALRQELAEASAKVASAEYVNFENAELRTGMSRASTTPTTSFIVTAVLRRPPFSPYDEIIIDAGSDKRLSSTSIVYANGNVPIGRVSEIFARTAKVVLFSSPGQKQDILIGQSHIPATAVGRGGGQYETELPRGLNVTEGDFVLSAGLNSRPIGNVVSVNHDSAEPFQKILFAPALNIYQLRWVSVDTGGRR